MPERDFYDVLGVPRNADADAIRNAYRSLARRLHPDVNKAPDAQAKFTEVQEAYDVLADDEKRRLYDRVGRAGYRAAASGGSAGAHPGGTYTWSNVAGGGSAADFDPDDLRSMFDTFFGGGRAGRSPFDARNAAHGPRTRARRAPARGRDRTADITVPFEVAARGGTRSLRTTSPTPKDIDVRIPPGIADGAKLRVRGEGDPAPHGPGDLILTVRIAPHPVWKRGRPDGSGADGTGDAGRDLHIDLPVTVPEAILGASIDIPTPGGVVSLAVPPSTDSGARLRLRGRGIAANGHSGDFYAVVRIVTPDPETLEPADCAAIEALAARSPSPRTGPGWSEASPTADR